MDITKFVHENRDRAFLVGDYTTYRSQLSKQLLKLRRRLGRSTPKNQKTPSTKNPITAADIANNHGFVQLQLLTAERAWAHAMAMKAVRGEGEQDITGSTRRHLLSRLQKATNHACHLTTLLSDEQANSKASKTDLLEAQAYAATLAGALEFEKHATQPPSSDGSTQKASWELCLKHFSVAHIVYSALLHTTKAEVFKEVLSSTVDPSIRYAAYQSRLSRTIPITQIAKQRFPRSDSTLVTAVEAVHPEALALEQAQAKLESNDGAVKDIPTSITWRGRSALIADASIGQALATTSLAIDKLSSTVSSMTTGTVGPHTPKVLAAAYDPVLNCAQDAVDAVRRAIAELTREGVSESDSRMQDLRVSDLAVNYDLVAWRIGRNRILTSSAPAPGQEQDHWTWDDGLNYHPVILTRKSKKSASNPDDIPRPEPTSKQLTRLTARITLYDLTLQSLDTITTLRGAARDQSFQTELAAKRAYFSSLRALNIARTHKLIGQEREALALLHAAHTRSTSISSTDLGTNTSPTDRLKLAISTTQLTSLQTHLADATTRQQGLVTLQTRIPPLSSHPRFNTPEAEKARESARFKDPLINHLHTYPSDGRVELTNLVKYPPELEPVPVKPIFLDLAWGFVEYPRMGDTGFGEEGKEERKRKTGWFGFGR